MWVLDLFGSVPRWQEPDCSPQATLGAELGGARMGLGMATQPAHSLQPRFSRSGGEAVVRAEEVGLVGRAARQMGRIRHARFHRRAIALIPANERGAR